MGDCYYNCHVCGTPLHHINEACPNCLPRMAERPPTFICPSCSAKEAEIARLLFCDDVWREKKRILENDLAKAWEDNKRLREAVEWMEDYLMGTIPEYPECANVQALDELRRRAKEG